MDIVHREHRDGIGRKVVAVALVAGLIVAGTVAAGAATGAVAGATAGAAAAAPPDDAPDERSNATAIASGKTVSANVSSSDDVDWYAVNATKGEAILPWLVLLNNSGGRGLSVALYDSAGERINETKWDQMSGRAAVAGRGPGGQQDARAVAPDIAEYTGTYYVAVRENPWSETEGDVRSPYNLTVETRRLDGHDPNENASTATPLQVGGSVEGVVAAYDHDVFAVNLTAGRNYTVTFTHLENDSVDRYLKEVRLFYDAANVTDATNPGSPGGPIVVGRGGDGSGNFTARHDGIHYLRVGQSRNTANLTNPDPYRMTITVRNDSSGDEETPGEAEASETETETPERTATDGGGANTATATEGRSPVTTTTTDAPGDENDTSTADDGSTEDDPSMEDDRSPHRGSATPTSSASATPAPQVTTSATAGASPTSTPGLTATPTDSAGPGFGAAVASVALLAAALLAVRRER